MFKQAITSMKNSLCFVIAFSFLLNPTYSFALPLTCGASLNAELSYERFIDLKLKSPELEQNTLSRFITYLRKRKVRKLLDKDGLTHYKNIDLATYEAYEVLKKLTQDDKTLEAGVPTEIRDWIERSIFKTQIENHLKIYKPSRRGHFKRAVHVIRKFIERPIPSFLINFTKTPHWKDAKVPESLLDDIARDGYEAHAKTLEAIYSSFEQDRRQKYKIFSTYWRVITTTVSVIFIAHTLATLPELKNDMLKEAFFNDLERLEQTLDRFDQLLDELE